MAYQYRMGEKMTPEELLDSISTTGGKPMTKEFLESFPVADFDYYTCPEGHEQTNIAYDCGKFLCCWCDHYDFHGDVFLRSPNMKLARKVKEYMLDWIMKQDEKQMIGKRVKTDLSGRISDDWTEEALTSRRHDVEGDVVHYHDAHGLTYEIMHDDGSIGHYEPRELQII